MHQFNNFKHKIALLKILKTCFMQITMQLIIIELLMRGMASDAL